MYMYIDMHVYICAHILYIMILVLKERKVLEGIIDTDNIKKPAIR